jgi:hypothetical protein
MSDGDKSFQDRVREERRDLVPRIESIEALRASEAYRKLDRAERDRLTAQLMFMRGYAAMLQARIDSFN